MSEEKPSYHSPEARKYISGVAGFCREVTGQSQYELLFAFEEKVASGDREIDFSTTAGCKYAYTSAECGFDCTYLTAAITIYPCLGMLYNEGRYEELAKNILHEICHGLFAPVQEIYRWNECASEKDGNQKVVERQVVTIERVISNLLPPNWFDPARFI